MVETIRSIAPIAPIAASAPSTRNEVAANLAAPGGVTSAGVASTKTGPATRSGGRSANSRMIGPPQLCPTSTTGAVSPRAPSSAVRSSARPGSERPVSLGSLPPYPARS